MGDSGGSTVAGTTFVIPVTIQETEAKTKQHRYLLARGSLWAGVKERTKRGGTEEEEGGGGGEEWTPWRDWLHKAVLAPFMSRKQSSRCSLAAGVSLLQQRSCFNEPLMRTCILPPHLCCEVLGDVLPLKHVESSCCTFHWTNRNVIFQWAQVKCPLRHWDLC